MPRVQSKLAQIFVTGGEATTGALILALRRAGNSSIVIGGDQEERRSSQIVNLIKIVGVDQVTLKVTIAEVSRNVMKQLGVNTLVNGAGSNGITFNKYYRYLCRARQIHFRLCRNPGTRPTWQL